MMMVPPAPGVRLPRVVWLMFNPEAEEPRLMAVPGNTEFTLTTPPDTEETLAFRSSALVVSVTLPAVAATVPLVFEETLAELKVMSPVLRVTAPLITTLPLVPPPVTMFSAPAPLRAPVTVRLPAPVTFNVVVPFGAEMMPDASRVAAARLMLPLLTLTLKPPPGG